MEKVLVTGSAGFIGYHLTKALIKDNKTVLGIDNFNKYYDINLKFDRVKELGLDEDFSSSYLETSKVFSSSDRNLFFSKTDITDVQGLNKLFEEFNPDKVVHLAAQAGVRYSLENPQAYISSNVTGFMNILECCRKYDVKGLIYASSSSVYGGNKKTPFSVKDRVDSPISIYAASKKSNELMAYSYSHLFGLHCTGLRFFTVYGPWGRPDMAMYIFTKKISEGSPINVFNHGLMTRDFTYIDDIISGTVSAINNNNFYKIYNLGNNHPENLMDMISIIEKHLGKKAKIQFMDIQPGDVEKTFADIDLSSQELNYIPKTLINQGIPKFVDWFKFYHSDN